MRKEIAQFLQTGQEAIARIRVEHVIREENILAAYEILELFCEFILVRVPIIETQKECPWELQEAISSITFSAPRCSDLPELMHVRNLFAIKYGKEFVSAASELRPESNVNRSIIEKLSARAPRAETKLMTLLDIAKEHNLEWDPSVTEEELCKKHEDLLDGSRQVPLKAESTSLQCASAVSHDGPTTVLVPPEIKVQELNPPEVLDRPPKCQTSNTLKSSCIPSKNEGIEEISVQSESRTQAESCDVLQIARAAIASAERATAAARAAANLANLSLSSKPADSVPPQSGLKDHVR
ncbi:IST1-like protein [Nymphaea thermarum]|nr:IST1-like protein [Nymphaea thermarum]